MLLFWREERTVVQFLSMLMGRIDWTLDRGGGSLVLVGELRLCGVEKGTDVRLMMVAEWQLKERRWER